MAQKDSARTTREKAAAARAEQLAKEKARQRRVTLFGLLGVLVVVGLVVGVAVYAANSKSDSGSSITLPDVDPAAALPKGVLPATSPEKYGVPLGSASTTGVLQVWEDPQCPLCGEFEQKSGAALQKLATDGVVRLVTRPAIFLDRNLPQSDHSSARAVSAWGCAIDAGIGEAYHNTLFANQPALEGTGFTDAQLVDFAAQSGLSGVALETFTVCANARTYLGWAVNSQGAFTEAGIPGTPNVILNGTEIPQSVVMGPTADLVAYITANAG
jgi:protein-disulfide isomerase